MNGEVATKNRRMLADLVLQKRFTLGMAAQTRSRMERYNSAMPLLRALATLAVMSHCFAIALSLHSGESLLRVILREQEEAWNRGDGNAFAKAFTEDSDFVNVRGDVFHGRAEIAARHSAIFSGPFKGSHLSLAIRRLTFLGSDVALIETDHELTNFQRMAPGIAATAPGVLRTHMKYVAVKRNGEWALVAAQNTAVSPPVQ